MEHVKDQQKYMAYEDGLERVAENHLRSQSSPQLDHIQPLEVFNPAQEASFAAPLVHKTIYRLRRTMFRLIAAIIFLITTGAIAGGVGGKPCQKVHRQWMKVIIYDQTSRGKISDS
jgi:hypothetical protein